MIADTEISGKRSEAFAKGFTGVVCICTATGQWFDMYICFLFYSLRLRKCISTRGVKLRDKGHALWSLITDTRARLLLASGRDRKRRLKFFTEALQSVKAAPLRGVLGKTWMRIKFGGNHFLHAMSGLAKWSLFRLGERNACSGRPNQELFDQNKTCLLLDQLVILEIRPL